MFKTLIDSYSMIVKGELNTQPSKTEPDMTKSIKEIIAARQNGIVLENTEQKNTWYSDQDIPDIEAMDIEEIAQYRDYLANERYRLEEELEYRQEALAQHTEGKRLAPEKDNSAPAPPTGDPHPKDGKTP